MVIVAIGSLFLGAVVIVAALALLVRAKRMEIRHNNGKHFLFADTNKADMSRVLTVSS